MTYPQVNWQQAHHLDNRQPQRVMQGLSFLVHADPKAGKSTFGATVPAPRVVLDAESGSFWAPGRKIRWNPMRETVPAADGSWDTAMVRVADVDTASRVYDILNSGQHPFNGMVIDSLTEVQQRIIDGLAGNRQLSRDQWGVLLRQVNSMIRKFRDLVTHPVKPLWGICYITGTHMFDGKWRPLLQGGSRDFVPYYPDIEGFIGAMQDGSRHLLIGPHPLYETGERVGGRLPYSMPLAGYGFPGWDIQSMIMQVNQ
jgi:AAA domain